MSQYSSEAPVPILPSSSGLAWWLQGAQGHLLDSCCLSAAAKWIPVLVLPFSSELGKEEVRGLDKDENERQDRKGNREQHLMLGLSGRW